ncbi:MAG: SpoIIE family protein phosphatase [Methylacidiphilales bacterium]|nr:SpoIIE family protein phosphatase [Candidatus Methylacidiphilales bacterium]
MGLKHSGHETRVPPITAVICMAGPREASPQGIHIVGNRRAFMEVWFTQHAGQHHFCQQDALLVAGGVHQSRDLPVCSLPVDEDNFLVAVADGVSGSPAAHRASTVILELLSSAVADQPDWLEGGLIGGRLIRAISESFRERFARGRTYGASTTLAALHVRDGRACVLNSGDSRVYRIRSTDGGQAVWRLLSKDHTILNEMRAASIVQEMREDDCPSIYRGLAHCIIADPEEDNVRVHSTRIDVMAGDIFLLMTDGVHDVLGDEGLIAGYDPTIRMSAQVAAWREAVFAAGTVDNLTLVAGQIPFSTAVARKSSREFINHENT